jgi:D-alanyl-D-alanine carboxypeptidase (penicillin-binding protein 5/6)
MKNNIILKAVSVFLALLLTAAPVPAFGDEEDVELNLGEDIEPISVISIMDNPLPVTSAILIDQISGTVLFEQNADQPLPPASITKVMTLLLVVEAIESGKISLEDKVTASELASSMGGSQIWLMPGEVMTVDELLRAVCIASANDASVALAEHVAGSEDAFIDRMNSRAAELGMTGTSILNCTGLDEDGHLTTARDIAIASKALIAHPIITEYSTIWMDELRGGETELVNTNRLVRFYPGATGLKTGTTGLAGSCLSATATRDNLSLVAVVMGAPNSDIRFASARGLLDYGFANFTSVAPPSIAEQLVPVRVLGGVEENVMPVYDMPSSVLVEKEFEDSLEQIITLVEDVQAPVAMGQMLGRVDILIGGSPAGSYHLRAATSVDKMTFARAFGTLLRSALTMRR